MSKTKFRKGDIVEYVGGAEQATPSMVGSVGVIRALRPGECAIVDWMYQAKPFNPNWEWLFANLKLLGHIEDETKEQK